MKADRLVIPSPDVGAREVARELDALAGPILQRAEREMSRLLSCEQLDDLPDPEWLVDGVLPVDVLAELWGKFSSGKSFLALSLALAVARGVPWFGCPVRQGPVIYIAGEGVRGLAKRRRAWSVRHNDAEPVPDFWAHRGPVQMLDPRDVDRFIEDARTNAGDAVALVVLDTVARSMAGGNENQQEAMSQLVASADRIREALGGATVLALHHANVKDEHRGSRVLQDAADAVWALKADESGLRTLSCDKLKDFDTDQPARRFRLHVVEDTQSCVLEPDESAAAAPTPMLRKIPHSQRVALRALVTLNRAAAYADWLNATGIEARRTFDNARMTLASLGYVMKTETGMWMVTDDGRHRAGNANWLVV